MPMTTDSHSYEEIYSVACAILAGRERTRWQPDQYLHLANGIAEVFCRRENVSQGPQPYPGQNLSNADAAVFLEVFWDLFRQGILTLGVETANPQFPHCRLTRFGQAVVNNHDVHFFHDVSSYENAITKEVPTIDPLTLLHLKEAMQAFRSGCLLSATVLLGVAAEHTLLLLLATIEANPAHATTYRTVKREQRLLPKINKFRSILDKHLDDVPPDVCEDLDINVAGIQAIIRNFKTDAGHPTGKIADREQVYVLLNAVIPYLRKMHQLIDHFEKPHFALSVLQIDERIDRSYARLAADEAT